MPEDNSSRTHDRYGHVMGNEGPTAKKTATPVRVGEQKEYCTREKPAEKSSEVVTETLKSWNTKELRVSSSTAGANATPARHSVESGDKKANVRVVKKSGKSTAKSATAIIPRSNEKGNAGNPTRGWTEINDKKQKPETKSILERLHEPNTTTSVPPRYADPTFDSIDPELEFSAGDDSLYANAYDLSKYGIKDHTKEFLIAIQAHHRSLIISWHGGDGCIIHAVGDGTSLRLFESELTSIEDDSAYMDRLLLETNAVDESDVRAQKYACELLIVEYPFLPILLLPRVRVRRENK